MQMGLTLLLLLLVQELLLLAPVIVVTTDASTNRAQCHLTAIPFQLLALASCTLFCGVVGESHYASQVGLTVPLTDY